MASTISEALDKLPSRHSSEIYKEWQAIFESYKWWRQHANALMEDVDAAQTAMENALWELDLELARFYREERDRLAADLRAAEKQARALWERQKALAEEYEKALKQEQEAFDEFIDSGGMRYPFGPDKRPSWVSDAAGFGPPREGGVGGLTGARGSRGGLLGAVGASGWLGGLGFGDGRRTGIVPISTGLGPRTVAGQPGAPGSTPGASPIGERPGWIGAAPGRSISSSELHRGGGALPMGTIRGVDQTPVDTGADKRKQEYTMTFGPPAASMSDALGGNYNSDGSAIVAGLTAHMPNPVESSQTISRDPFVAAQQAKALGFAGRAIRTPNGPVLAFTPEGGASATGDTTGTINWEMLDPVAPYAGGISEPSGPRGGGPSGRTRMANQAIEALYPEGSGPGADEDDETLAAIAAINTGRPMPAPEAPGDPAAMRFGGNVVAVSTGAAPAVASPSAGMIVAYSAGVGSPTFEFDGAGRVRRVGR